MSLKRAADSNAGRARKIKMIPARDEPERGKLLMNANQYERPGQAHPESNGGSVEARAFSFSRGQDAVRDALPLLAAAYSQEQLPTPLSALDALCLPLQTSPTIPTPLFPALGLASQTFCP
jgi:hypothetical protein